MLTLEEAQQQQRCRYCECDLRTGQPKPGGWQNEYRELIYPIRIRLNFGDEFCCGDCAKIHYPDSQ